MAQQPTTVTRDSEILGAGASVYLVETAEHIDYMRVEPDANYWCDRSTTIDLGTDLADSGSTYYNGGEGWIPIGQEVDSINDFDFTGTWEGNGVTIQNLKINRSSDRGSGLFRRISGAGDKVFDVFFDTVDITASSNISALAGVINTGSITEGIKSTGSCIATKGFGGVQLGGSVGFLNNAFIQDSYSEVNVSDNGEGTDRIGGFVGRAFHDTGSSNHLIKRCYSNGNVSVVDAANSENNLFGGLLGTVDASDLILASFYDTDATGPAEGGEDPGELGEIDLTPLTSQGTATFDSFTDITVFQNAGWDIVAEASHDGQKATALWYHDGTVPRLWYEKAPVNVTSGTLTFENSAFAGATVDFIDAPYSGKGTLNLLEQVTADGQGVATTTVARDPLKDTFAIARGVSPDFTGTVTSVSGDVLTLPSDLTGISIGGVNDDHYLFRATGGTGSGEEVTVTDRTGNDITVPDGSIFDNDTTYTLGRFVKGFSKVFPKD